MFWNINVEAVSPNVFNPIFISAKKNQRPSKSHHCSFNYTLIKYYMISLWLFQSLALYVKLILQHSYPSNVTQSNYTQANSVCCTNTQLEQRENIQDLLEESQYLPVFCALASLRSNCISFTECCSLQHSFNCLFILSN